VTALVLFVDDSSVNVDIVQLVLRLERFEVVTAQDGHEALQLVQHTPVDIALIDVRVPGSFALVEHLKGLPAAPSPILVALVSYDALSQTVALLEAGFDDTLPKPLNTRELPAYIRDQLARRHTQA
jgi:two-component system cell cycle response regulator